MATKSQTIKEILAARDDARAEIFDKSNQLENRAESIRDNAYGRALTQSEIKQLQDINAALGSLSAAENQLMLMTVQALDRSEEVTRFVNVLTAANTELTAKLKDVQTIANNIKRLNKLFSQITSVINALTKLAAFII